MSVKVLRLFDAVEVVQGRGSCSRSWRSSEAERSSKAVQVI